MQPLIPVLLLVLFGAAAQGMTPPGAAPTAVAPSVAPEAVRQARASVRHEQQAGENGIITHRFLFDDGARVEFMDRPKRPRDQAKRERIVFHVGSERAAQEPDSTFDAAGRSAGLSPTAIAALRFVSRHEGGFDAINTWDRARFSWGFIQFAGGYGFPPALAHVKRGSPALFRKYFVDYGVDVAVGPDGAPQPLYYDLKTQRFLRGDAAEQAYGDDLLVVALFIRAGKITEFKQRQVEAAIRDYAAPALASRHRETLLVDLLRSAQSQAMLIDRKVHEGNVGRLENALDHALLVTGDPAPTEWPRLEGLILDLAIQDADARGRLSEHAENAALALERAAAAVRMGTPLATAPGLTEARRLLEQALYEVDCRMTVGLRRIDLHYGFWDLLEATNPARLPAQPSVNVPATLEAAAMLARDLTSRLRFESAIRNRLRNIRTSELPGPPPSTLHLGSPAADTTVAAR